MAISDKTEPTSPTFGLLLSILFIKTSGYYIN